MSATNLISTDVAAYIDGDGTTGISAGSISLTAEDVSTINALAGAAALSLSFSPGPGISASIAATVALNSISNEVDASIRNAAQEVQAKAGDITLQASEQASITSTSVAAAASFSASAEGLSIAAAGVQSTDSLANTVQAWVESSANLTASGAVSVSAGDTATLDAEVDTASISAGLVGLAVGDSQASNTISDTVAAFVNDASVTASGGNISVTASSTPTITTSTTVLSVSASIGGAGAGASSTTTINGTTEASLNGGTFTAKSNEVKVTATSSASVDPTTQGASGGAVSVAVMLADSEIHGATEAFVGGQSTVTAAGLSITATDTSHGTPETSVLGVGGLTGAGAESKTVISRAVSAYVADGAKVSMGTGAVTISATSTDTADGTTTGVSGGAISITALVVDMELRGSTVAWVGDGVTLTAGQLTVSAGATDSVTADTTATGIGIASAAGVALTAGDTSRVDAHIGAPGSPAGTPTEVTISGGGVAVTAAMSSNVTAKVVGTSVGLVAGIAGAAVNATSSPTVSSYLGQGTIVQSDGDIRVSSLAVENATALGSGFSVSGGASVGLLTVTATADPQVSAAVDSGASITSVSGNVEILAGNNYDPTNGTFVAGQAASAGSDSLTAAAGLSFGDSTLSASAAAVVNASVLAGATVRAVNGQVSVVAEAENVASSASQDSGGAAISASTTTASSEAHGTTTAALMGNVTAADGSAGASTVLVIANAADDALAAAESSNGGAVTVGTSNLGATSDPTVSAEVGGTIQATGAVTVQSFSATDAHATSESSSGGAVDVTTLTATSTVNPAVSTTVDPSAVVNAGGTLTISSSQGQLPPVYSDGTFSVPTAVDTQTSTINLGAPTGLQTGDTVIYNAGTGNVVIGGLVNGRTYGVIVPVDSTGTALPNDLQLGVTFNASQAAAQVNLVDDTITFPVDHHLQTGDRVIYQAGSGNAEVGGLLDGSVYVVQVIDARTIKLLDPGQPFTPLNFTGNDVAGNTITIAGNGFTDGQPVTYNAAQTTTFNNSVVNVVLSSGVLAPSATAYDIFIGTNNPFRSGDEVIYTANGTPVNGLVSGNRYWVIYDATNPDFIQLASSYAQAVGSPGDPNANPPVAATPPTPIPISLSTATGAGSIAQSLLKVTDQPIGGLADGVTYYVANATTNTFQLAPTRNDALAGTNILSLVSTDPQSGVVLSGTSTIGTDGVDLTAFGTGVHALVIQLTATGSGTQTLDGVGGAAALASAAAGDGVATASESSSGGGVVQVGEATASVSSTPTDTVTVGAGAQLSARDLFVSATSYANVSASSANGGGGGVNVGQATASISTGDEATVAMDTGASLKASHDITISSDTVVNANVLAATSGGGGVDYATARALGAVDYSSQVQIGSGVTMKAGNQISVSSLSEVNGTVVASADASGLGANADANDTSGQGLLIGSSSTPALTETSIGSGAFLTAPTVDLNATVTGMNAYEQSGADSSALGASTTAQANVVIYDTAEVLLQSGASVLGTDVSVQALHQNINAVAEADASSSGLGADTTANANTDYQSLSQVQTQQGSSLAAGNLTLNAAQGILSYARITNRSGAAFDSGDTNQSGNFNAQRAVIMNGNVSLLASPDPVLLVDGNGKIIQAVDITVNGGMGQGATVNGPVISVDPITGASSTSGTVLIETNTLGSFDGLTPPDGTVSGTTGTVNVRDTYNAISITSFSSMPLVINGISVVTKANGAAVTIDSQDSSGLAFAIAHDIGPTAISIQNKGASDLTVAGLIDNPIGSTAIASLGSILEGAEGVIRTNSLQMSAAGGIGSAAARVDVELVLAAGMPTDVTATAGASVFLQLTGRVRGTGVAEATFSLGTISAGGDVDLLIQPSVQDGGSTGNGNGGILVIVNNGLIATSATLSASYPVDPNPLVTAPLDARLFADTASAVQIASQYTFVSLTAVGNIVVNAAGPLPTDTILSLSAGTDLLGTGSITVLTNGNISLTESSGDLRINSIESTAGDVSLSDVGAMGSIYDIAAADGTVPWVIGNNVTLASAGGAIGSVSNRLEMDSAYSAAGNLTATAQDGIFITETTGDLSVAAVGSAAGNVMLAVDTGSLLDGVGGARANIQGASIDLRASDSIGTAADPVRIDGGGSAQQADSSVYVLEAIPGPGTLYASAGTGIFLTEASGGMSVLSAVTTSGDIGITVNDSASTGEDLQLLASGVTLDGTVVSAGVIGAPGPVTLTVGDNVTLSAGATVSSQASVTVSGDNFPTNPDPNVGAVITIAGTVSAPVVTINGGPDLDTIQLLNPVGINAAGTTTVNGNGADDRVFIDAIAGPTTVNLPSGAGRVYVAGNASADLFTTNGLYNDGTTTNPLDIVPMTLLSGTLANIASTLTINLGTGGNNGSVPSIYVSAEGESSSVSGALDATTITGLGMPGGGSIVYNVQAGAYIYVGLSPFDDTFSVTGLDATVAAFIYGGAGNDTLDVGSAGSQLTALSGNVAFFGDAGTNTLNVYGDASSASGQLSAISVTGMGMGTNQLISVDNGMFDAGYSLDQAEYPAAIYYAVRSLSGGTQVYTSTVQAVNIYLDNGANSFAIDSTLAGAVSTIYGGTGSDVFTVGTTGTGLQPNSLHSTDFIAGTLVITGTGGTDSLVVDDSGESVPATGTLQAGSVTGLGISGSFTFSGISSVEVDLGAGGNTFFVAVVPTGISATINAGSGFDTVYVGTTPGQETAGSLDSIQGTLLVNGQDPQTGNALFLNDQSGTAAQTYTISNSLGSPVTLTGGETWYFDTTTVVRTGMGTISYQRFETVVLNASQGDNTINVQGTQREQDPSGGHSSVFVINTGSGNSTIYVGAPVAGGYSLDSFAIESGSNSPAATDTRGVPVIVNGQGGNDVLQYLDTAETLTENLAFVTKTFAELFPGSGPGGVSPAWLALFTQIFGGDPTTTAYDTVALGLAGQTSAANISARGIAQINFSLGSGNNVVQLTSGLYAYDITVYGGTGNDTFNVENGVNDTGHSITLNGGGGNDLLLARFTDGVPAGTVFITFNGGTAAVATLRIEGDGVTSGGQFTPSATAANAGVITVGGNTFTFTGVGPMIIDGLPDFQVITPDSPADITVGTIAVADLNLTDITLHVLTVNGVVAWTQQSKLEVPDALDTLNYGQSVAMSGNTLVVGSKLTDQLLGTVFVYTWNGSAWVEQAKLYPQDRFQDGGFGFGASVAIDGSTLVVGAPLDNSVGTASGAVYVFTLSNGVWQQTAKLTALNASAGDNFGQSVAVSGSFIIVGAPSGGGGRGQVYFFSNQNGTWLQEQELTGSGAFGTSVGISGLNAVVGAPGVGTATVFTFRNTLWNIGQQLLPSDAQAGEGFGQAVAMDSTDIVVGAPFWTDNPSNPANAAEGGRAFIFELVDGTWVRVARLTAQDGLLASVASATGAKGEQFGAAVAVSGNWVVVGAPQYNGHSMAQGEAYVFYRYTDPATTLGPTWVRTPGGSGGGNLGEQHPSNADNFGAAVAVSGDLLVAGIPGHSETGRLLVGAIRTFLTDGIVPSATQANLEAEIINPAGTSSTLVTFYDPSLRMLFVGNPQAGTVQVYVNEDLYWRPTQQGSLSGPSTFGTAIDEQGGHLVVGAPGVDTVYLYTVSGETWSLGQTYRGQSGSQFGASVAISGYRLVIGAPNAAVQYYSVGEASSGYVISLGSSGAAFVWDIRSGPVSSPTVLMPYDSLLPYNTSVYDPYYVAPIARLRPRGDRLPHIRRQHVVDGGQRPRRLLALGLHLVPGGPRQQHGCRPGLAQDVRPHYRRLKPVPQRRVPRHLELQLHDNVRG